VKSDARTLALLVAKEEGEAAARRVAPVAAPSLRLDTQFLSQRAPLLLLTPDDLRGAFGCASALGREPERQQPLLDVGALEVLADLAIEPRHHLGRRAGGSSS
jgi:hypothetical protein